jgi:WD40 repeat protein/serine/threonine protein kinase
MSSQSSLDSQTQSGWNVGDVVENLYEVRDEITSGGMGVVYRVHHRGWNIDLAVKTPRPELVSSPQRIADFETEAQTWVELGLHPNIVACVYVRRLDGLPRVFAEWIDTGSLSEAIESGRLYEGTSEDVLARILDVAIQFAWGLDYAHSRGLVHQDVKPQNVMIAPDWTVKVTDFGLAKARVHAGQSVSDPTAPGISVLAGYAGMTPAYCSPEQASAASTEPGARAGGLTRATDVWSWAISVWEMFVSEPPCRQGQAADQAFAAYREDPWVDDPGIPAMPEPLANLLGRCFDPNPTTRPRRIGELADELAGLYAQLIGAPYARSKPEAAKLAADGFNNAALSMLDLGRVEEAEQLWKQALATDPHHLHTVYNYGLHRWRAGQITDETVISDLEAVRTSHPGPNADRLLAQVHLERCDTDTARRVLSEASRNGAADPETAAIIAAANHQPELSASRVLTETSTGSIALSADGRTAICAHEATMRVWDVPSGRCLRMLEGHRSSVKSIALSADGRAALSTSPDSARVWDVNAGQCLRVLEQPRIGRVWNAKLSADGRIALVATRSHFRVWDVPSGKCLRTLTKFDWPRTALSADGQIALTTDGPTVRVWNVSNGQCLATLAHPNATVTLNADGHIAAFGHKDNTVRVWDLPTQQLQRTLSGHTDFVNSVALSADARTAVSGSSDKTVRVWDMSNGRCLRTFIAHTADVREVALSADGTTALSTSSDRTVRVWDAPTASGRRADSSYARPKSAQDLITAATGVEAAARRAETLLAAGDGFAAAEQLRAARAIPGHSRDPRLMDLWRHLGALAHPRRLRDAWPQSTLTEVDGVKSVALSADGGIAVSCGRSYLPNQAVQVWDTASGRCLHALTGHTNHVQSVAVSADGRIAVSGSVDKTVRVWDLQTGQCQRRLSGHSDQVLSVAISADGRVAVSGGLDETVRVWDVESGRCLQRLSIGALKHLGRSGHTEGVTSVALSADAGTAVSGGFDRTIRVWDLPEGRCRHTLTSHFSRVTSVTLSADAKTAMSSSRDKTVRVWDLDTGQCVQSLTGQHAHAPVSLSADGRIALAVNLDGTIRLWHVSTAECLRVLSSPDVSFLEGVALSGDANWAVVQDSDSTMRVWALDWDYEFTAGGLAGAAATHRLD